MARQRKALTPGFSNVGIRNMTPVFYDSAYKVRIVDVRLYYAYTVHPARRGLG